ncbi:hypothetical protein MG295_00157 [Bacillus phage vB_BcgM]|nr:hypothetical protein MG295_00157 [Bacillus phage vB_BcgM]
MSIQFDTDGIRVKEGTIIGESAETVYELTLLLVGKANTLKFESKPSDELITQLIELTGAYKATLQAIKTTTTEYQGKSIHTFKLKGNSDIWKQGWVMENSDTTLVGGKILGY